MPSAQAAPDRARMLLLGWEQWPPHPWCWPHGIHLLPTLTMFSKEANTTKDLRLLSTPGPHAWVMLYVLLAPCPPPLSLPYVTATVSPTWV